MPEQYFDWTKGGRERSFFGGGVAAHVSTARPVSVRLVDWVATHAAALGLTLHRNLSYACVEGPRLGTRAESLFLRQAGCHLVGMTNVPEAFLAREAQLCYASIGIVTDYDCWHDDPALHVSVDAIFERYHASLARARSLLDALLAAPLPDQEEHIRHALRGSMVTRDESLTDAQRDWLAVLRR
jgi:5'-methylthioadenosine phosphorylase